METMFALRHHRTSLPKAADEAHSPGRLTVYLLQVMISLAGQLAIIAGFLLTYWLLNRLVSSMK
jgi:hypothetical protein